MRDSLDPYLVLGVSPTATQAEIAHAYRRGLQTHHPDTRGGAAANRADDRLQELLDAYRLVRDPARRADHDAEHKPVVVRKTEVPVIRTISEAPNRDIETTPLRAGPVRWQRF